MADRFLSRAAPEEYIQNLGFIPYNWQLDILAHKWSRLLLNCARQSGKSTVTAALAWHAAKTSPRGLVLVFAPTERQSVELNVKLMDFAARDGELDSVSGAKTEKKLKNGCRLFALPGTEKSIRGFSDPTLIIIDEASRTYDLLYRAVRPMMLTGNTRLIAMSTPYGQDGWFYREWENNPTFRKILVKAPVDIVYDAVPVIQPVRETEAAFSERMRLDGIEGFYSSRHGIDFMREEWESEMPEWWYRQEYLGEFMESEAAVFSARDIKGAFDKPAEEFTKIDDTVADETAAPIVVGLWD